MILGIDFGSSNIDVVLIKKNQSKPTIVNSISFFSNMQGIDLNEFINEKKLNISLKEISFINVTGFGAKYFAKKFQGIPVKKVSEIEAIAFGAAFVSNEKDFLAASLGGGTCLVSFHDGKIAHVGGSAVGGKTLLGLGKLLLNIESFEEIASLAEKGRLENIDLLVEDLYPEGIGLLDKKTTAAHFGNIKENHSKEDLAFALFNLVAQSVGGTAAFSALANSHKKIVFTGKLAESKLIQKIIKERISILSSELEFIFPKNAGIATAIGAALF